MQLSIFSSEELPAKASASPDSERDWLIRVATSCSPILPLLSATLPAGWSGKTSPVSCHQTADGILAPSSEGWQNSGMGSHTGFLTLSTLESPSNVEESSLSHVLEIGEVQPRFYLSTRACQGYLRRIETILSRMSNGGLGRVEYLIALMQATARSGEVTSGTPADM